MGIYIRNYQADFSVVQNVWIVLLWRLREESKEMTVRELAVLTLIMSLHTTMHFDF